MYSYFDTMPNMIMFIDTIAISITGLYYLKIVENS